MNLIVSVSVIDTSSVPGSLFKCGGCGPPACQSENIIQIPRGFMSLTDLYEFIVLAISSICTPERHSLQNKTNKPDVVSFTFRGRKIDRFSYQNNLAGTFLVT